MKRLIDILISGIVLVMAAPVYLALALLVRIKLGAPILFRQERVGLRGSPFQLFKFRTMLPITAQDIDPTSDADRLTAFGRSLRATSLDEIPGFWNVFRGDMSLVGPRPLLPEYLDLYTEEQKRRHSVKPGITGWAAVKGRNSLSWEERFELDIWYVDHQSLWLDLKILCMTVGRVLARDGISADGQATMPKFTGSKEMDT